jgi:hypothetical protein
MTKVGYNSDTEDIVKAFWPLFHHDGPAAFPLSARSPLPPALSANYLPGGRTQNLNARRIPGITSHLVENDEESATESISDTEHWLNWNCNLDKPNDSEEDCAADDDSDIEHHNCIKDPECPEQQVVSSTPNEPGLVHPTQMSKRQAEKVLVTVNAAETWKNNEGKKMYDRMRQWFNRFR